MDIGNVRTVAIDEEMRESYLDYAMSVIVARALPDARDGLKPVHRRILYVMHDMGLRPTAPYKKSARIVGEVLGKYHPHGDGAVYDAMARLAQDFSMRYPLVDGQGNFGSIDGDSPAAMRYTEARLAPIAEEMLLDLEMNTVDWTDNFDGSLQEPTVLPSRLPNLLVNGSSGIAVGMATNIPPHNLREVAAAVAYVIDRYDDLDNISVDDLMQFIKAPDFPTGATIIGGETVREVYATGRGKLVVRATCEIEELKGDRHAIIVSEIPYQVSKTLIIERIAQLVREGRLEAVSDLRDESDRQGMRIVIELKRGAQPLKALNQLYKFTHLQTTMGVQLLALVEGEPRTISLKRALQIYIEHRREVIRRRSEFELEKMRARAHILEGYLKALDAIDAIIKTIREAEDTESARNALIAQFEFTEAQARAILELQLRRLAALEHRKIAEEYAQVRERIAYLEDLLANPVKILALIKSDLNELAEKFGDPRRTRLDLTSSAEIDEADLVRDEEVLIAITQRGYVKRSPSALYRAQARGGRGMMGITTREEDTVEHLISANSLAYLLFFTNYGKVYAQRTYQLPEADRTGKGTLLTNLISLSDDERVTAVTCVDDFERGYLVLCTRNGKIKRVKLSEFASVRASGLIAISLEEDDRLQWVRRTSGSDRLMLVTANGRALLFEEDDVRPMGRAAAGVRAIRLQEDDNLVGMDAINHEVTEMLIVTARGYSKRVSIAEYPLRRRFSIGVRTISPKAIERFGAIVAVSALRPNDEVTFITRNGMTLRTRADSIRLTGRAAQGVRALRVRDDDQVVSVATVKAAPAQSPQTTTNGHGADAALSLPQAEREEAPDLDGNGASAEADYLLDVEDDLEEDFSDDEPDSDAESMSDSDPEGE
ncbi:MAG: DNA gyrase subunit A [Candidatus Thermofonsia Clade 1 bacterium]|uniref:DNA gyrase subunit A n=1 Tax=Candidatus Thermofonsia Clade 1 bacterium TaxID=2364210 RepID=A0A2M8P0V2_9CHLR|nr:MAG: DNA gyrase subunit A [Candidatus Thermofonsia Clade 1 bacterium]